MPVLLPPGQEEKQLAQVIDDLLETVDSFKEHLALAKTFASNDERIVTFIDHTLDEENERAELLHQLKQQLGKAQRAQAPAGPPVATTLASPVDDGHYRLRDEVALTVGSLYGARQ